MNIWDNLGLALLLLDRANVTTNQVHAFLDDSEHGLEHGLLTAYWAIRGFEYKPLRLLGCVLHDLGRFTHDEQHDRNLIDVVDYLAADVYNHSSPSVITSLIKADRIELIRYEDAENWIDTARFPEIESIDKLRQDREFVKNSRGHKLMFDEFAERLINLANTHKP
jgi:hypothetical protein